MSTKTADELLQNLVESFRSLLDEALIVAIANDHDLQTSSEYEAAHIILRGLARDVTTEEASGFNPSGLSEAFEEADDGAKNDISTTETSNGHRASQTGDTDASSTGMTSATSDSAYLMPSLTSFDNESEESKILQLQGMFSELKEYDIKHCLKKASGDFQIALDELLNIQYLRSTGQQMKGVDGFFQPEDEPGAKRKHKKKTGNKNLPSGTSNFRDGGSTANHAKEMKRQDEIAYIADRLNLPYNEVSEIYHKKRYSSGATAVEIMDQHLLLGIETQDEAGKKYAKELADKYHNVPAEYMATLVQFTGSMPQWSDDIAALLSKHFAKNPRSQKLDLNYNLAPLSRDELEGIETMDPKTLANAIRLPNTVPSTNGSAYTGAIQRSTSFHQAKRQATVSAAQLNRRGGSNSLYRQAAGYYAESARDHSRNAQQATSTAADFLVEQQSSANSIDLHGVYIRDGVRIARQKVQAWWSGLGEFRSQKARQQNFTVITGLGRHSAGGVSQLRQAVAAALLQDGWKMQVETGRFVITGRR